MILSPPQAGPRERHLPLNLPLTLILAPRNRLRRWPPPEDLAQTVKEVEVLNRRIVATHHDAVRAASSGAAEVTGPVRSDLPPAGGSAAG
jgi:hypothetical protein